MARRNYIPDCYKNLYDWSESYSIELPAFVTRVSNPSNIASALLQHA